MRNVAGLRNPLALLAILGTLAGCLGTTQPSRFYVLSATEPMTERMPSGISVSVGPVSLPKYLDRPEIVTRPSSNALDLAQFDRWGGRLEDNVVQVLAEDLSRRLKTSRVSIFPPDPATGAAVRVSATITSFERVGNQGDCVLEARWRVADTKGSREPALGTFHVTKRASGPGYEATVAAMSEALDDLAGEIAGAILDRGRNAASR
jgi:hypothetical protein